MTQPEKMSLKAFWEAVEQRLAAHSADELRAILRVMAYETMPTGRLAFVAKLEPIQELTNAVQQVPQQDALLADIDDLAMELKEAMAEADAEEQDEWGQHYDDEDSLGPYVEFIEPLAKCFDQIEAAFDYRHFSLARAAYQKLFELLNLEDAYGRGVRPADLTGVDMAEAHARYLRAVYETEPPNGRPQALFEQLGQVRSRLTSPIMMLDDLIQISPQPLPDQEQFLVDWIDFLRTQSGRDADRWLREAIWLSQGISGMEALVRAEGQTRPRAYLDWFTALAAAGGHHEVLQAAQEALKRLPAGLPIRAAIADHLCTAASRLDEVEVLAAGRWEAFLAKPTLARLLDLGEAARPGQERTRLMQRAAQHIQGYLAHPPARQAEVWWGGDDLESPAWIDQSVLAHASLLAEDFEAVYQRAGREQVLGWSSSGNSQGLAVPFFLVLLSGTKPGVLPPNLAHLWEGGLQSSLGFRFGGAGEDALSKRLVRAYETVFATASLADDRQPIILAWCLDVVERRVAAIVSGQHRSSYDKAAVLTAAGAETLQRRGDQKAADLLVNEVRNRFPRHRAFQAELKAAVGRTGRGLR